jgi:hypothetical protein
MSLMVRDAACITMFGCVLHLIAACAKPSRADKCVVEHVCGHHARKQPVLVLCWYQRQLQPTWVDYNY